MQPVAPFRRRVAEIDRLEWEGQGDALVALNARVAARLRARIRSGRYTRAGLRQAFRRLVGGARGFDALDVLVAGLLDAGPVPDPSLELGSELVAFAPTPARVVLDLVELLSPDDVLVDLGSGLGRVPILAALLSGCRARGIEREPAYCAYADRSAAGLGVAVTGVPGDARTAAYDDATCVFLFTPFRGSVLASVLERVPRGARVVTYGPCTAEIPWRRVREHGDLAVFARAGA